MLVNPFIWVILVAFYRNLSRTGIVIFAMITVLNLKMLFKTPFILSTSSGWQSNIRGIGRGLGRSSGIFPVVRDFPLFLASRLLKRRALLKDPFAVISVPWFISALDAQVVIMVRHPIPFVSSLKRLGWSFDFDHLLNQPLLMRDHLEPFRSEMVHYKQNEQDIVGQGILLWRMIYLLVHQYKTQGLDIQLIRHEDLSQRPLPIFEEIFHKLGIVFSQKIEEKIIISTQTSNPDEVKVYDEHAVRLNSLANLKNWKKRLTDLEIERIDTDTRDVVKEFYELGEWKSW
jgi:hypothetical protein